ncbi:MAG: amidohydrolase family protein [Dehalococcoidia bacterium]
MRVDVHCHIVPESCLQMTYRGADGQLYGFNATLKADGQWQVEMDGVGRPTEDGAVDRPFQNWFVHIFDVDRRLRHMDQIGMDVQSLAVPPFLYFYAAEPKTGLEFAQKLNNAIAKVVESHPDRFIGLATVPLQDPPQAVKELERAVDSLGMKGVEIGSNVHGRNLDEPEFRPFFTKAEELGVPIFIHPHYVLAQERLSRYHLGNLIGNPTDTTVAVASLIFGGVMADFPNLKVYLAHAGGCVPYIRGRWEHGWRNNTTARKASKEPPSYYLSRFHYDTIAHWGEALAFLIKTVGADKVMLGTDYPFDMGDYQPVQHVDALEEVPQAGRRQIIEENAPRLFNIGR